MKSFEISVASKTFLLGEYAVLKGQGALLLATEPRFKLMVSSKKKETFHVQGIHPESPAGKMIAQDNFYNQYHFHFMDPYSGLGGFGASSSQFIMLYAFKKNRELKTINLEEMLDEYKKFAWEGEGLPPSGADLIAQLYGKICYYSQHENQLKILSWPFPELGYCLIHTGNKLATHSHLKNTPDFDGQALNKIVQSGLLSIETENEKSFIESISQYALALQSQHLMTDETKEILHKLAECSDILACKGCGALGADVILVIYNLQSQAAVLSFLKQMKSNVMAYGNHISEGINIREII